MRGQPGHVPARLQQARVVVGGPAMAKRHAFDAGTGSHTLTENGHEVLGFN